MLLKGCVATPLARVAGAALQKRGWEDSQGYYVGIGAVTVATSVGQIADADAAYLWRSVIRTEQNSGVSERKIE